MEDNRAEQKEALEVLLDFNERLVKNLKIIIKELSGQRLEDTDKFVKGIVDAINWEVQVVNGTIGLLNDGQERVNKDDFNRKILALSDSIKAKDDSKMAAAFRELIPIFQDLGHAAQEVTA